jgi:hypothetical protein
MGFCISSSNEDKGINSIGKMAIAPTLNSIDQEVIDMALASSNPMNALKSKVTLTFSAEGLPNLDKASKSDPMLVIWQVSHGKKTFLGQTEAQKDTLNPVWVTSIDVDYFFEQSQLMLVEVYDVDDANRLNDLHAQEIIGNFEFTLGKVVSGKNQELTRPIKMVGHKGTPKVKIMATEKKANYGANEASFTIECTMKNSNLVFILINKFKGKGKYHPVYKSETLPRQQGKYDFGVIIDTDTLCDNHDDQEILIQAY